LAINDENSLDEGVALLEANKVGGIVYDQVLAQSYISDHRLKKIVLSNYTLGHEEYAFALPYESHYTKAVNISIIKFQDNQMMDVFCRKHLGEQAKYCQL